MSNNRAFWVVVGPGGGGVLLFERFGSREGRALASLSERLFYT